MSMSRAGLITTSILIATLTLGASAVAPADAAIVKKCPKKSYYSHHKRWCKKHKAQQQTQGAPQHQLSYLIAPKSSCSGQSDQTAPVAAQEAAMRCMTNYAREHAGRSGLGDVPALDTSADEKDSDILRCHDFSHQACGRDFLYWFEQVGYIVNNGKSCWRAGENLAWGTGNLGSVRSIFTAWVHSPEHLENMLSSSFNQFGVALQVGRLSGFDDAHVWTSHFGSHC